MRGKSSAVSEGGNKEISYATMDCTGSGSPCIASIVFEVGMTWGEFIDSEYNHLFTVSGRNWDFYRNRNIPFSGGGYCPYIDGNVPTLTDAIIPNGKYSGTS